MRHEMPKEAYAEITFLTIQNEARWMEFEEDMEGFSLLKEIPEDTIQQASVFLCGYLPVLEMEMAILGIPEMGKGIFFSKKIGETAEHTVGQEFSIQDYQKDFELNMLMYAATTQIMMRNNEEAYHNLAAQLTEAKGGCSGCHGCGDSSSTVS